MIFIYPTDTSYGIGCDARDAASVEKIFKIKGRAAGKTVPLIAASARMVVRYVDAREWRQKEIQRAVKKYWPGALTLVLHVNVYALKNLAPDVIAKDGTIAIRVPDSDIARGTARSIGAPIVATSANLARKSACYSAAAAKKMFAHARHKPDCIVDTGALPKKPASTIARFAHGRWEILRQGKTHL